MKCVCISCFDHYNTRMGKVTQFFVSKGFETSYLITDYHHFKKMRYQASYPGMATIQVSVPKYEGNMSVQRLYSHFVFSNKVYKLLKKIRPDIIYCMFPPNSLVKKVSRYKKKTGCKLFFDCYDMWPESFPYGKIGRYLKIPFLLWGNLRDRYLDYADLIISVSEEGRDTLSKKVSGTPVSVIKPALSATDIPRYGFDITDEICFLYLGNINHIIDIKLGADLLSNIAKKKRVVLHIIGEGQYLDSFVELLRKSNIEVILHGVIFETEKKKDIFSKCDFGLNIPKEEIHSSMPLKAIEYMNMGLPFLNGGEGDITEIVEEESVGININREDIQQTVKEIIQLTNQEIRELSKNCVRCYEERFSNENYDEIFREYLLE